MPKRGCDININEIARLFKLHSRGLCEVISFTVPRKVQPQSHLVSAQKGLIFLSSSPSLTFPPV